jgi:hypothetical protein
MARERRPALRIIHGDESFSPSSLAYWRTRTVDYILDSFANPANDEYQPLIVRPDGTVLNGNTRLFVLEERGYDINMIPWEPELT